MNCSGHVKCITFFPTIYIYIYYSFFKFLISFKPIPYFFLYATVVQNIFVWKDKVIVKDRLVWKWIYLAHILSDLSLIKFTSFISLNILRKDNSIE